MPSGSIMGGYSHYNYVRAIKAIQKNKEKSFEPVSVQNTVVAQPDASYLEPKTQSNDVIIFRRRGNFLEEITRNKERLYSMLILSPAKGIKVTTNHS